MIYPIMIYEDKNSSLAFPVLVDILTSKNARETRLATAHLITQGNDSLSNPVLYCRPRKSVLPRWS